MDREVATGLELGTAKLGPLQRERSKKCSSSRFTLILKPAEEENGYVVITWIAGKPTWINVRTNTIFAPISPLTPAYASGSDSDAGNTAWTSPRGFVDDLVLASMTGMTTMSVSLYQSKGTGSSSIHRNSDHRYEAVRRLQNLQRAMWVEEGPN